jgi:hypothetical protein
VLLTPRHICPDYSSASSWHDQCVSNHVRQSSLICYNCL